MARPLVSINGTKRPDSERDDADGAHRRGKQTLAAQRKNLLRKDEKDGLTTQHDDWDTHSWTCLLGGRGGLFAGVLLLGTGGTLHAAGWWRVLVLHPWAKAFLRRRRQQCVWRGAPPPPEMNYSNVSVRTCHPSLGWCSYAHCAPCCHPQRTTSPNELAQGNRSEDMLASLLTPRVYPRSPLRLRRLQTHLTSASSCRPCCRCDDYARRWEQRHDSDRGRDHARATHGPCTARLYIPASSCSTTLAQPPTPPAAAPSSVPAQSSQTASSPSPPMPSPSSALSHRVATAPSPPFRRPPARRPVHRPSHPAAATTRCVVAAAALAATFSTAWRAAATSATRASAIPTAARHPADVHVAGAHVAAARTLPARAAATEPSTATHATAVFARHLLL